MEFSGRLASFPIAELLTWAANDHRTGALVLRRTSREKRIYFERGEIVACLTDSTTEFYGQHLLLEGHLDPDVLTRCLVKCQEEGKRLGVVLVDEGIVDRDTVERTLAEQLEDLIRDVFLWDRGIFFFQADQPPAEDILAQPVNTLALVLEGTQWIDELIRIRQTLTHDNLYLRRATDHEPDNSSPRASAIFRKLKSAMSVARLYQLTGGSYFRFLLEAHSLQQQHVLKVLDQGKETPKSTHELPLSNLLLEQAAEEQMSHARRGAIPMDVVESLVPVWARAPGAQTWTNLPESEREFLSQIDGSQRLSDLLSDDRDAREQQAELLTLQLRKGALALIPSPVQELERDADERGTPEQRRWWRPFWKKD
ncbi:MAG: DUF4388 domain-containing protein [bacterium]|nr:DUF4388 domain-containing protein [bacterium]